MFLGCHLVSGHFCRKKDVLSLHGEAVPYVTPYALSVQTQSIRMNDKLNVDRYFVWSDEEMTVSCEGLNVIQCGLC